MTRHAAVILALFVTGAAVAQDETDGPKPMRVMTFNVRFHNPRDGEDAWPHRRDWVAEIIRSRGADLVGCQEALRDQVADLEQRLPGYAWYGVGREDGQQRGEFVPVFYRQDRFKLVDRATFWLSETPGKPGSRGWDANLPRTATVVRLQDRQTAATLLVVNTHFDNRGAAARANSARLLLREITERRRGDEPVILMGDLNCLPDSEPYRILAGRDESAAITLQDARAASRAEPAGPASTWNGFARIVPDRRIDYIFVGGALGVASYRAIEETRNGRFPSDHLPVLVELTASSGGATSRTGSGAGRSRTDRTGSAHRR